MKICNNCNSNKSYVNKHGNEEWRWYNNKIYCKKCANKLFMNPKYHPLNSKNRFMFKDKEIWIGFNPRTGICNWCRAVVGIDCKKTELHHELYDESNTLANTIELCTSCHKKESWRLWRIKNNSLYNRL